MRKYGIENFYIELIEETDNPEEREIYWIEQKQSFKYGYNATKGGDGKKYLDYNLIIALYKKNKNAKEIASILNCDYGHIRKILKNNNYDLTNNSNKNKKKAVAKCDKNTKEILEIFPSITEAAKSLNKPMQHISDCANNKRKSAYGYVWQFINK